MDLRGAGLKLFVSRPFDRGFPRQWMEEVKNSDRVSVTLINPHKTFTPREKGDTMLSENLSVSNLRGDNTESADGLHTIYGQVMDESPIRRGGDNMHHDFFDGVEQVEATIAGKKAKLPVFYRSARSFTAIFPATFISLRRLLPDSRYAPAQIAPGVGAVHLTAFEYYDTDIEPYNEFAIGILLNDPQVMPFPGYNLLRQLFNLTFHTYIHHLPVTTEIALRGGIDVYNYPKFLADIDFTDTQQSVTCELKEKGDLILRLEGQKIEASRSGIMKFLCHLYQYKQLQGAEFKVNALKYAIVPGFGKAKLELGSSHPVAVELRRTLLATQPLMYMYMPEIQCILYGPDRLSLPLVVRLLRENMGVPIERLAEEFANMAKSQ